MPSSDLNRPHWDTSRWRTFQEEPSVKSPSIGNVLGTIAIAFGIGLFGYYMLDGHSHSCENCGHRWRHLGVLNHGDPVAHTCKCGTVQWWKDGVPHVFREVLRQPPPKPLPDALVSKKVTELALRDNLRASLDQRPDAPRAANEGERA